MNKNSLDPFEQFVQNSANEHIEPLDMTPWEAIEKKLPKSKGGGYKSPWIWGAAAILAISLPVGYLLTNNEPANTITQLSENTSIEKTLQTEVELLPNNTKDQPVNSTSPSTNTIDTHNADAVYNETTPVKLINDSPTDNPTQDKISETKTSPAALLTEPKTDKLSTTESREEGSGQKGSTLIDSPAPISSFVASSYNACEGETITFTAKEQDKVEYLWSFGDGTYSNERIAEHTYSIPGIYTVSLIVQSKSDKNKASKSDDENFTIHPSPNVSFEVMMKDENGIPYAAFINRTDRAVKWLWQTGDGESLTEKEPTYTYHHRGNYNVTLKAENEYGCQKTITQPITISEDYNLLAPNSFTPNGDGINDNFIPMALTIMDVEFVMTIISPTEGIIYETKSISRPWDGTNHKSGSICSEGAYKWVVSYVNKYGKTEQFTGVVLLLK
jgi:PKD repeat protein